MPKRAWGYVLALGLIIASEGQAQEQAGSGEDRATAEQSEADASPFAIPVQIIEEQEAAEARERGEAEARQREIDDLAAQEGMNEATQAMNDATQRMAFYSLIGTITVVIGTALLVWTLLLTRQANQAAQAAVTVTRQIGEAQTRAYLSLKIKHVEVNIVANEDGSNLVVVIKVEVHNSGSTPAYSPVIHFSIEETQPQDVIALPDPETLQRSPLSTSFIAAHDAHKNQLSRTFWVVDPVAFQRFEGRLIRFSYCVSFWDEFGVARRTPVITGTFVGWPKGMITFMPDRVREPIEGQN